MKILAIVLAAILTCAVPALAQTSTSSSESATEKMKGYSIEKKNEAVAYGKKLVSDLDVKIKDLEAQVSRDASSAKADAKRGIAEMKAKRAETRKKLDEMGKASAQSWDTMKQGFADAYKDLQQAYDKTVANLKK